MLRGLAMPSLAERDAGLGCTGLWLHGIIAFNRPMDLADLVNVEPWWRFAAAVLIGALVGLEREHVQQVEDERSFAGIRTFSLMGLLGALLAFVSDRQGIWFFLVPYFALCLLVVGGYIGALHGRRYVPGTTTEIAALMVPLLGALIVWDEAQVGLAVGVVTALVLAAKDWLHAFARRMSDEDLLATLQFALMALVILPLLPDRDVGPMGVWSPFEIWLMVVLVSGISFLGYVLMKQRGAAQGVELAAILGGLVSSTATTASFAGRSKRSPSLGNLLAIGITLASCVMLARVLVEVAVVHSPLLAPASKVVGAMLVAGVATYGLLRRRIADSHGDGEDLDVGNPLRVRMALTFGAIYALVLLVLHLARTYLGTAGLYVASGIAGLTDVDAVTLSVANLARDGRLDEMTAATAIGVAAVANTVVKAAIALFLGTPALRRAAAAALGAVAAVGVVALALAQL